MVCSGNEAGGVVLFGGGGLLTADKGLTFDSSSGTLAVRRLRAFEVPYSILFNNFIIPRDFCLSRF